MSFLEQFFDDNFGVPTPAAQDHGSKQDKNSFDHASDKALAAHLEIDTYGGFRLTEAVRPAIDLKVEPTEGYRHEYYNDEESGATIPVVMATASREKLFDLFISLIEKLGPVVDVVLESSHEGDSGGHRDFYRDNIDMPILKSILYDYEDLLLNDGCTGIAVLNPSKPQEVQFEEHKLLIVYGSPLEQYEFMFEQAGVHESSNMKFITEAEHVHSSSEKFLKRFEELRCDLGLDGSQTEQQEDYLDEFNNDGENWNDGDLSGGLA